MRAPGRRVRPPRRAVLVVVLFAMTVVAVRALAAATTSPASDSTGPPPAPAVDRPAEAAEQPSSWADALEWAWMVPPGGNAGLPAVDSSGVVLTYGHVAVAAVAPDGRRQWVTEHHFVRDVAPAVTADAVFAASDGGVVALRRTDGVVLWADDGVGWRANTPVVAGPGADPTVVVSTWDGAVAALSAGDGGRRWHATVPGTSIGPPATDGSTVIVAWEGTARSGVTALDAVSGERRWQVTLPAGGTSGPAVDARRGLAMVVTGDGTGRAFGLADGRERWRVEVGSAGAGEVPPGVDGRAGTVALAGMGTHRVVVRTDTGEELHRGEPVQVTIRGGPVVGNGWIAIPTDDGRVVVDSLASGTNVVLDPPGRVSALAVEPGGERLVVSTRGDARNGVFAVRPSRWSRPERSPG